MGQCVGQGNKHAIGHETGVTGQQIHQRSKYAVLGKTRRRRAREKLGQVDGWMNGWMVDRDRSENGSEDEPSGPPNE